MNARAGVFDDDLSDFLPRPAASADAVRGVAERAGFRSRDPAPQATAEPPGPPGPRIDRRYRTGRNRQLNIKVRAEDAALFYAIADAQGWVLGETFAQAIAALQDRLSAGQLTDAL